MADSCFPSIEMYSYSLWLTQVLSSEKNRRSEIGAAKLGP